MNIRKGFRRVIAIEELNDGYMNIGETTIYAAMDEYLNHARGLVNDPDTRELEDPPHFTELRIFTLDIPEDVDISKIDLGEYEPYGSDVVWVGVPYAEGSKAYLAKTWEPIERTLETTLR